MSSSLFLDRPVILVKRSLHVKETSSSCRRWPSFRFQNQTLGRLPQWKISLLFSCDPHHQSSSHHHEIKWQDSVLTGFLAKLPHPIHFQIFTSCSCMMKDIISFQVLGKLSCIKDIRSLNLQIWIYPYRHQVSGSWQALPPVKDCFCHTKFLPLLLTRAHF